MVEKTYPHPLDLERTLPKGKLVGEEKYSDDPSNPHMTATIRCEGFKADDLFTDTIEAMLQDKYAQGLTVSTGDNNELVLQWNKLDPHYNVLGGVLDTNAYLLNSITKEILDRLQEEFSKKEFSIGKTPADMDKVYTSMYLQKDNHDERIIVDFSAREHDYDHKKKPGQETLGFGNDPVKLETAMAALDRLLHYLQDGVMRKEGSSIINKIHIDNIGNIGIRLEIEVIGDHARKVFTDMADRLDTMEAQSISGGMAQKILVAKPRDENVVKADIAAALVKALPGPENEQTRARLLTQMANIAMGREGQSQSQ